MDKRQETASDDAMLKSMVMMFLEDMVERIDLLLNMYEVGLTPQQYEKVYNLLEKSASTRKWKQGLYNIPREKDDPQAYNLQFINKNYNQLIDKIISILNEDDLMARCGISLDDILEENDSCDNAAAPSSSLPSASTTNIWESAGNEFVQSPLPNAENMTLKFKIKMKHISKPPVWREVEVPASYNFEDLHTVIQIIFGWGDEHLWQFQSKAYNSPFSIRFSNDDDDDDEMFGFRKAIISPTVGLTSFFKNKNDKLEYIYDFGDDWIHEISVVELIDKRSEYPLLTKSKGNMMIENIGGAYGYMACRDIYNGTANMPKKEKKEFLYDMGFNHETEFIEFMEGLQFNLEDINDELRLEFGE